MVLVTDNFNRADTVGPDLGTNWTNVSSGGFAANGFQIATNVCVPTTVGSDKLEFYSGATFSIDQYAQAKITVTGTTAATGLGVALRCTSAGTCYRLIVSKAVANNIDLKRFNAGVTTALATRLVTWVDGDTLRLEVTGNVLRMFQNGVQLGADVIDTSMLGYGPPGIIYSSTVTSGSLDDFQADDITNQQMRSTTPEFIYIRKNT